MRVLSFSGDMCSHPEDVTSLRDGVQPGECTIIDLLGVTDYDEGFTSALCFFLKRCLKAGTDVVLVADRNVARRLHVYGLQRIARIVGDRETGVKLAATLEKFEQAPTQEKAQRSSGSRRGLRAGRKKLTAHN